jgi:hypothetical protein
MTLKLPKVYSDTYQLTLDVFDRTKSFPKQMRPNLGRRLEEASLDLTSATRKMLLCSKKDESLKKRYIQIATESLDDLKFLTQLASDLTILTASGYGLIGNSM